MPPHHRLDLNRWSNPHGVRETADGQFQNVRRVERFQRHDGRAAAWPEKPSICAHEIFLLNTGRPSSGTAPTWKTRFVKSISMVVAFLNGSPSLWLGCAASPSGYTMPSGLRQTPVSLKGQAHIVLIRSRMEQLPVHRGTSATRRGRNAGATEWGLLGSPKCGIPYRQGTPVDDVGQRSRTRMRHVVGDSLPSTTRDASATPPASAKSLLRGKLRSRR